MVKRKLLFPSAAIWSKGSGLKTLPPAIFIMESLRKGQALVMTEITTNN